MTRISIFYQKTTLFFGTSEECSKALRLIDRFRIPCERIAAAEYDVPVLHYGFQKYTGLEEIKKFLEKWGK